MGWRRAARSFGLPTTARGVIMKSLRASSGSSNWERDARRRQREIERQRKELAHMQELERAKFEVSEYENYLEIIRSIHKDCGEAWDWQKVKSSAPPEEPQYQRNNEIKAQEAFNNYVPSFFDRLFHKIEKKKSFLLKDIDKAKASDGAQHKKDHDEYLNALKEWKTLIEIAGKICSGDFEAYVEAIKEANPFEEIKAIGSSVEFSVSNNDLIECNLHVHDEKVILKEEKTLLKSGRLSVKPTPTSRFYDLYQDYVCGCVLRIARELFALLPVNMLLVHAQAKVLNTKTGCLEDASILSVAIPRETLEGLNFNAIDPLDSMKNFVHRMSFKKGKGFGPVDALKHSDFSGSKS
jgi:hypothetical protein